MSTLQERCEPAKTLVAAPVEQQPRAAVGDELAHLGKRALVEGIRVGVYVGTSGSSSERFQSSGSRGVVVAKKLTINHLLLYCATQGEGVVTDLGRMKLSVWIPRLDAI